MLLPSPLARCLALVAMRRATIPVGIRFWASGHPRWVVMANSGLKCLRMHGVSNASGDSESCSGSNPAPRSLSVQQRSAAVRSIQARSGSGCSPNIRAARAGG